MKHAATVHTSTLLQERGFQRAAVTPTGAQLFETRPELLEAFGETTHQIITQRFDREDLQAPRFIGGGYFANVYTLPGHDDLCVKTLSIRSMRAKQNHALDTGHLPNMFVDLRFMDLLRQRLARVPEQKVFVPQHHATVYMSSPQRGYAMLEQKLPAAAVSINSYFKILHAEYQLDDEMTEHITRTVKTRVAQALGGSLLRWGINDLTVGQHGPASRVLNGGNSWIDPQHAIEDTPLYLIDLVRGTGIRRPIAGLLGSCAMPLFAAVASPTRQGSSLLAPGSLQEKSVVATPAVDYLQLPAGGG